MTRVAIVNAHVGSRCYRLGPYLVARAFAIGFAFGRAVPDGWWSLVSFSERDNS